jgi:hypothetical protein
MNLKRPVARTAESLFRSLGRTKGDAGRTKGDANLYMTFGIG